MELAIDEQCVRVLALQQPEASDLRFVAAALKMVTESVRPAKLARVMRTASKLASTRARLRTLGVWT